MRIGALTAWTREHRSVVIASFLGWTLDAFDFFLMVFVLKDIAQEFNTAIGTVRLNDRATGAIDRKEQHDESRA